MVWVNQVAQGVLLGGYYAMVACGLSFMFGVMRVINLAHGSLAVSSAFCLWVIADVYGVSPFLGLFLVVPLLAFVGVVLQRAIIERSMRAGVLVPILSTFGLSIVFDNLLFETFGADTRSLAPFIGDLPYEAWPVYGDIYVGKLAVVTFGCSIVIIGSISVFLSRTQWGRAIRATAQDPDTVAMTGVNPRAMAALAAAIATATAAVAGAFLAIRATFDPYSGAPQLVFAFEAAVIGGVGSLWGTLAGGVLLGVAQSIGAQVNSQGFMIAGHATFLLVLLLRGYLMERYLRFRFEFLTGKR
ncbi:branched-chain amino acid ABC transporter permease [Bradyrhizobium tropiciagri]|uniref:branched-chain amino acid ABC transporter permease n=1 Tax=Bradyrhizobium tropiciagri TaxID=312253 RepID=UPI001BA75B45|nr:branched-chain amino acid ABC transporter permease [Bradyrhizobium tropiciagri]MBR0896747.1 branched-chain amino acid ABC transporter permease [Bradyrhizobium tropiciagri]